MKSKHEQHYTIFYYYKLSDGFVGGSITESEYIMRGNPFEHVAAITGVPRSDLVVYAIIEEGANEELRRALIDGVKRRMDQKEIDND